MADESAKLVWGHWNVDRTARVHRLGQVTFSDDAEPGGTVAVIDTSRDPEWRLTARIFRHVVVSVLRPRHRFGTKNPSPVPVPRSRALLEVRDNLHEVPHALCHGLLSLLG